MKTCAKYSKIFHISTLVELVLSSLHIFHFIQDCKTYYIICISILENIRQQLKKN